MLALSRILSLSIGCFMGVSSFAQLQVSNDMDAQTLVNNFLLGSGVLIDNVTVAGSAVQYGSFINGDETVSMADGMVLSSADVTNIDPSNNGGGDVAWGDGIAGDADMLTIANLVPGYIGQNFNISTANDMCTLEFDFVPLADSLSFNYAFGSDEYLEWVNSSFNDMFAFFISGPGINGPYSAPAGFPNGAKNIAFVPGTDPELPITVSSINDQLNAEYYIDNFANENISIDGYTTVLTATAENLTVGETYHIRLSIADGSDTALESIVMLEGGSFSCYESIGEAFGAGDLDGDSDLDVDDLLILLGDLGCEGLECIGDLDGNGIVNVLDVLMFLGLFNE
ncbi:MAG: hypothetical protein ACJAU0_001634 [Flavobacteriales bacterium]|jgi:hypothetical protein